MLNEVTIQFNPTSLIILNGILAFMMFGVSLNLRMEDFKRILRAPVAPMIGLFAQFVLLPALTAWLCWWFAIDPYIALGMILVASCPGGSFSNIMTYIARGNVAVSVSMTGVSSLAAIIMTPLNFMFYGQLNPITQPLMQEIAINPLSLLLLTTLVLALPLVVGMTVGVRYPRFADGAETWFRGASLIIFLVFVGLAFSANTTVFLENFDKFALLVIAHNALALLTGAIFAYFARLRREDRQAVTLEVGIQNSGLALSILFTFFADQGAMMVIAAFWGVWHLVSGLSLALFWSWQSNRRGVAYGNA